MEITKKQFVSQLVYFIIALLIIIFVREYFSYQLIQQGVESYNTHTLISFGANVVLIIVSLLFIKKNKLSVIAGVTGTHLNKWYLLIFPLVYLVSLNLLFLDDFDTSTVLSHALILLMYSLSIGFSEELSIRGFMQSHLINYFGHSHKSNVFCVFASALFFGVIHLLNFDKGLYGELSQVFFATFIGVMFGVLVVITRRLYPLIIIHAVIDFVADLDSVGLPILEKISNPTELENALISVILVLPCLLYGLFLMKKYDLTKTISIHNK